MSSDQPGVWRERDAEARARRVERGELDASALDEGELDVVAEAFLAGAALGLEAFAGSALFDRVVVASRATYPLDVAPMAAFFAVSGAARIEEVVRGFAHPERLIEVLAASPLGDAALQAWAFALAREPAGRGGEVLCVAGALLVRGLTVTAALAAVLEPVLAEAWDEATRAHVVRGLGPEVRERQLLARFAWSLVEAPCTDGALDRVATELRTGHVHGAYDEGPYGAPALGALVRLGEAGIARLAARAPDVAASWLFEEARALVVAAPREGVLAAARDGVWATLFVDVEGARAALRRLWSEVEGGAAPPPDGLTPGRRRVLDLSLRTVRRVVDDLGLDPRAFGRVTRAVARVAEEGGAAEEPFSVPGEAFDVDDAARTVAEELERLVEEYVAGRRDEQSGDVEAALAYAMVAAAERDDQVERRRVARAMMERWLDEDVPAAASDVTSLP